MAVLGSFVLATTATKCEQSVWEWIPRMLEQIKKDINID
jgi:hypothetical protein